MKKTILIPALVLTIIGVGALGTKAVNAQGAFDGQNTLVQRITSRFNLNEDEVQAVFDEHRDERHAQHVADIEAKLDEAVKTGKLTEAQKTELLVMLGEKHEDMDNLTPEERRAQMGSHKDELQKWADENNVDLSEIMPFGRGEGKGRSFKGL